MHLKIHVLCKKNEFYGQLYNKKHRHQFINALIALFILKTKNYSPKVLKFTRTKSSINKDLNLD